MKIYLLKKDSNKMKQIDFLYFFHTFIDITIPKQFFFVLKNLTFDFHLKNFGIIIIQVYSFYKF